MLNVSTPKERTIVDHIYNYVAAPAVAAADHNDEYVNYININTKDDSDENKRVCS